MSFIIAEGQSYGFCKACGIPIQKMEVIRYTGDNTWEHVQCPNIEVGIKNALLQSCRDEIKDSLAKFIKQHSSQNSLDDLLMYYPLPDWVLDALNRWANDYFIKLSNMLIEKSTKKYLARSMSSEEREDTEDRKELIKVLSEKGWKWSEYEEYLQQFVRAMTREKLRSIDGVLYEIAAELFLEQEGHQAGLEGLEGLMRILQ